MKKCQEKNKKNNGAREVLPVDFLNYGFKMK